MCSVILKEKTVSLEFHLGLTLLYFFRGASFRLHRMLAMFEKNDSI
jgi:hypothetical protein